MAPRAALLLASLLLAQTRPDEPARPAGGLAALAPVKVLAKLKGRDALGAIVHLRSGRDVAGLVVDVTDTAVLMKTVKSRTGDFSLSWLELAAIEGVTLPDGAAALASHAVEGKP